MDDVFGSGRWPDFVDIQVRHDGACTLGMPSESARVRLDLRPYAQGDRHAFIEQACEALQSAFTVLWGVPCTSSVTGEVPPGRSDGQGEGDHLAVMSVLRVISEYVANAQHAANAEAACDGVQNPMTLLQLALSRQIRESVIQTFAEAHLLPRPISFE